MSSISRAHPPPLHSVPASFLLRSSTTSISSNSISTPVYSSFFFSPSVLFPSLPGSWVYSSSSLLLLTVYLLFPHRLWWRFEPFIAFAFLSLFFFFFGLAYTRCYTRLLLSSLNIHHARYVGSLKARTKRHPVEKTQKVSRKDIETKSDGK